MRAPLFLAARPALTALLTAAPGQAQRVGIGTTAPTQALDVSGQRRVRGLMGTGLRLPQVQASGALGRLAVPANDPAASPVLLHNGPAGGTDVSHIPFGLALDSTTVYTVGGNLLDAYDVSNPGSPRHLSRTPTTSFIYKVVAGISSTAVALALFNGPGFVSYASGSTGKLQVHTCSTASGPTDRGFSFVIFQP